MSYLDNINSPEDIKKLNLDELETVADEIRAAILNRVSRIGGHVGSNLGAVELTLALHYVFDAPNDKIIFDVSHQSYAHKILTGRKNGFLVEENYQKITGFYNPSESPYDTFYLGHTSTSVSLAAGLAKARDLNKEKHNVIALIGDGALSGGEAFEGLNFAASELKSNLIIVVNDNGMSIAENHGGLYQNLKLLRETNGTALNNFFKTLGFSYRYVSGGHDIKALIKAFNEVKNYPAPIVLHVRTQKGKGYRLAEENKEVWHKHLPFDIKSGETSAVDNRDYYNHITFEYLDKKIKQGDCIAVITAGMPHSFGFKPEQRQAWGKHYIDVGIAEEHAVSLASAMAKGGSRAVFCVGSTFIQRTYDQLLEDLALNKSPAVILVYGGGIADIDVTHSGIFDMAMMGNIPNLCYFAPAFYEEYTALLDWALSQNEQPVVIRVPKGEPVHYQGIYQLPKLGKSDIISKGFKVAIMTDGNSYRLGKNVCEELKSRGITPTHINAHYMSKVDESLLNTLAQTHELAVTIEDGVLDGGYGEKVARFLGATEMKVMCFGADKVFTNRVPLELLKVRYSLTPEMIVQRVVQGLKEDFDLVMGA